MQHIHTHIHTHPRARARSPGIVSRGLFFFLSTAKLHEAFTSVDYLVQKKELESELEALYTSLSFDIYKPCNLG